MKNIFKLLPFVRPYWKRSSVALVLLTSLVFFDLSIPRLIQRIIDQGILAHNQQVVIQTALLMIGISLVSVLIAVGNNITSVQVGESIARDLRDALFTHIQAFSYGNLDEQKTGQLLVCLTSDTTAVQRVAQVSLRIGTRAPLLMLGSLVLMFNTNRNLALTMLPLLLLTSLIVVFFVVKMEPLFQSVQQKLDRLNTVLQENIAGARLVKAFVRADFEGKRFESANEAYTDHSVRVMQIMSSMSPVLTMCVNIGMVIVIWAGGMQSIRGELTLGQIVAFTNYLMTTMGPLTMMTMLSNTWASGLASAKRVNEVLDTVPEVQDAPEALSTFENASGRLVFENVSFHYNGNKAEPVLDGINLVAEPGQTVAILGSTGAGKSTLVNLVPRFYDVSCGRILLDGLDIRLLKQDALLTQIGIVPQETVLFSGSVRDNIRYGVPTASDEEVVEAAQAAQAHDFIVGLSQGYETHIEERGTNLSGGQKQRLAIARALLTKPKILILDDSTSSVDVETETKIQDALANMRQHTSIVVAQRISTVLKADKIVVIDNGRIAAEGTHRELMQSSPIYQEIYESQLGNGFRLSLPAPVPFGGAEAGTFPGRRASMNAPGGVRASMQRRPAEPGKIEKARDARNALARLLPYLSPFKVILVLVLAFVLIYTVLGLIGPYLMGVAIDKFIATKDAAGLVKIAIWMLVTYLLNNLFQAVSAWLMADVSQRALKQLRKTLFGHLQTLPISFFDSNPAGDLMSRLTNDIDAINQAVSQNVTALLASVLSLVGILIAMFVLDKWLALASLLVVPIMFWFTEFVARYTRRGFRDLQKQMGGLNAVMEEAISGQKVVKAFRRNESSLAAFRERNEAVFRAGVSANSYALLLMPLTNVLGNFFVIVLAGLGGWLALQGLVSVGIIATFISYGQNFIQPLRQLANMYNSIQAALAGAERVFEIIDTPSEVDDAPEALALAAIQGHVQFDNVKFGYQPDKLIIKDMTLEAKAGETFALVGPTGAGKTTIINLLTRFYEINGGSVKIDGTDIREIKKADLRRQLGLVLQDTFLFSGTVLDNIRYGRLEASDEECIQAAKMADADHFIRQLPHGYQTNLSERASNLSQGQRQLLSIARAILADPAILILDEATSSVDTRTEARIQKSLLRLMQGRTSPSATLRTSFVIAHRLSTIRDADQVLVIHDGEIVEKGTHQELLDLKGFYHHLYLSQFKGEAI